MAMPAQNDFIDMILGEKDIKMFQNDHDYLLTSDFLN